MKKKKTTPKPNKSHGKLLRPEKAKETHREEPETVRIRVVNCEGQEGGTASVNHAEPEDIPFESGPILAGTIAEVAATSPNGKALEPIEVKVEGGQTIVVPVDFPDYIKYSRSREAGDIEPRTIGFTIAPPGPGQPTPPTGYGYIYVINLPNSGQFGGSASVNRGPYLQIPFYTGKIVPNGNSTVVAKSPSGLYTETGIGIPVQSGKITTVKVKFEHYPLRIDLSKPEARH